MRAPRILWLSIFRDLLIHSLLGLLIFTIVLVAQSSLSFLDELLAAGIGFAELWVLLQMRVPTYLSYGIPTSVLFGILLTFGRMSSDSEVIALRASGVSVRTLLVPVMLLGLIATAVTGYLTFEVEPGSREKLKALVRSLGRSEKLIRPGSFRNIGSRTLYVHGTGTGDCPLRGVLIGDFSNPERSLYISAECGAIDGDPESSLLSIRLRRGSIHLADPHAGRYRRIRFQKMATHIDLEGYVNPGRRIRELPTRELLELRSQLARGEELDVLDSSPEYKLPTHIHRRFAFPLASLALALLALPLGIRPVRTGRSWGAIVALALPALYWGLFSFGEKAGDNGWLPAWIGLWIANVSVAGLGLFLLGRISRSDL